MTEILTMATLDILFLLLVFGGAALEKRLRRAERALKVKALRLDTQLETLWGEVEMLKARASATEDDTSNSASHEERLKAADAEKRFSEGVASIFGYDCAAVSDR